MSRCSPYPPIGTSTWRLPGVASSRPYRRAGWLQGRARVESAGGRALLLRGACPGRLTLGCVGRRYSLGASVRPRCARLRGKGPSGASAALGVVGRLPRSASTAARRTPERRFGTGDALFIRGLRLIAPSALRRPWHSLERQSCGASLRTSLGSRLHRGQTQRLALSRARCGSSVTARMSTST